MSDSEVAELSRSATDGEWFEIGADLLKPSPRAVTTKEENDANPPDHSVMFESRVIFYLPGDHDVFRLHLGEDFRIEGREGGRVAAVLRLKPEWFAPNYDTFDYDVLLRTAVGDWRAEGQIRVR